MNDTAHTPTPWHCDDKGVITGGPDACTSIATTERHKWASTDGGLGTFLTDEHRRERIAQCDADGDLIVRAVNAHADLLAALRELVAEHETGSAEYEADHPGTLGLPESYGIELARAAIAKATD